MGDQLALGDVVDVNPESLGASTPSSFEFRYIDLASVSHGRINWGATSVQRFGSAPTRARRIVRDGDVLFGTVRPVLRSHAALRSAPSACVASTGFAVVRARDGVSDPGFLAHYLLSDVCAREAHRVEVGSNYPAGNESDVRRFALPRFTLNEQRQIAEVLDAIDDTIAATERLAEKLRQRRDAFRSLAVRPAGDWVRRPLRSVVQSAVDGPFGSMLKSAHYVDAPGRRVVRLANLGDGEFLPGDAFISERYAAQLSRHEVREGDILVASLGDEKHRPGRACLYPPMPKGIVKADCFRLRLARTVADPYFLMMLINGPTCAATISRMAQGVTRDRVNLNNLLGLIVAMPSPEAQRAWVDRLVVADSQLKAEVDGAAKARELRTGLADDLLTGRVGTVSV